MVVCGLRSMSETGQNAKSLTQSAMFVMIPTPDANKCDRQDRARLAHAVNTDRGAEMGASNGAQRRGVEGVGGLILLYCGLLIRPLPRHSLQVAG
jgi:hypothetical protein